LKRIVVRHPGVRLLLLHGSRARDDAHTQSDWDVGYLADGDIDPLALTADVADALATDRVDVVDLARASALLRFEAARDGRRVHERSPGDHDAYALEATLFWCDVEGVVRRAGAAVLAELAP
jgi:predicted nucleotidyltransferase